MTFIKIQKKTPPQKKKRSNKCYATV